MRCWHFSVHSSPATGVLFLGLLVFAVFDSRAAESQEAASLPEVVRLHENTVSAFKTIEMTVDITSFATERGDTLKQYDCYYAKDGDAERTVRTMELLVEPVSAVPEAGKVNDRYYDGTDLYTTLVLPEVYESNTADLTFRTSRSRYLVNFEGRLA